MPLLSVIVPTYNESGNIIRLSKAIGKAFSGVDYEVVFIDDNSQDNTAAIIRSLPGFGRTIKLLERSGKLGLASAVAAGAKKARGKWIIVMDADLSHPPQTARVLFDNRGSEGIVIASRNGNGGKKNLSVQRDLFSRGAELLAKPFVNGSTADPLSGFFLLKRDILTRTNIMVKGYKILLNILYDNPELAVTDIPYTFYARHSGKTKLDLREILNYPADLMRLIIPSQVNLLDENIR